LSSSREPFWEFFALRTFPRLIESTAKYRMWKKPRRIEVDGCLDEFTFILENFRHRFVKLAIKLARSQTYFLQHRSPVPAYHHCFDFCHRNTVNVTKNEEVTILRRFIKTDCDFVIHAIKRALMFIEWKKNSSALKVLH
jgi:hypothetical protein